MSDSRSTTARIEIRLATRIISLIKMLVAGSMTLVAIGLVGEGIDGLGETDDQWLDAGKIVAGLAIVPFAFWATLSNLRAAVVRRGLLMVDDEGLTLKHPGIFRKPVRIPRSSVVVASFDDRSARLRRFRDHMRFEIEGDGDGKEPVYLYSKAGGAPFPVMSHTKDVPNLALMFAEPLVLGPVRRWTKLFPARSSLHPPIHKRRARGLLMRVKKPEKALLALEAWGVVRTIHASDLQELRPTSSDLVRVKRLAFVDNAAIVGSFTATVVLPFVLADPISGPILSPGYGVCRQMGTLMDENPRPEGESAELPALLDQTLADAVDSDDYTLLEGGPVDPTEEDSGRHGERLVDEGFQRGYYSRWASPRGSILIEVVQLGDEDDAEDYTNKVLGETCPEASSAFAVPQIEGAVGLQWFTNFGVMDEVVFERDDVHVFVAVASLTEQPDRQRAVQIARRLEDALSP